MMRSLVEWPATHRNTITHLFTDLDETLTSHGRLSADVYRALEELRRKGIQTIIVTGRSAGWGDLMARLWPVAAVVAESGGLALWRDGDKQRRIYWQEKSNRAALLDLARDALSRFPFARLAVDCAYREVDIAFDYAEEEPRWEAGQLEEMESFLLSRGAKVTISSIHLHAWFGDFTKFSMSQRVMRALWGLELECATNAIFIGDSLNDASMFVGMKQSIGVANIRAVSRALPVQPAYITAQESGAGFLEVANALLNQV